MIPGCGLSAPHPSPPKGKGQISDVVCLRLSLFSYGFLNCPSFSFGALHFPLFFLCLMTIQWSLDSLGWQFVTNNAYEWQFNCH